MWTFLVRFILRNRLGILIGIVLITGFMTYFATKVSLSYEMGQLLPASDSINIKYNQFKKQFGEDGSVIVIGVKDPRLFELDFFRDWVELSNEIQKIDGIEAVVSIGRLYELSRNESTHKFDFKPLIQDSLKTQADLDSLRKRITSLPLYKGLIYNEGSNSTLMTITLNKSKLFNKNRVALVDEITTKAEVFGQKYQTKVYHSGLPFIRTMISLKVQHELKLFVILALIIASLALFFFFRSFKAVIFPMLIVLISIIWALGFIALFNYKITMLTGIIPPLMIIIVVENCIFLLNKYHYEYRAHGNKVLALSRIVKRVGYATMMTNLATAVGFASFIYTQNRLLVEFGIIASINIMVIFILTLFLIPIFFSYLDPPKERHIKHLDNSFTTKVLNRIVRTVQTKRNTVYIIAVCVVIVGIFGVSRLKSSATVVDDLPRNDRIYTDLQFFEKEFKGTIPFEIVIDTKKKKGVLQLSTIQKIDRLQDSLKKFPFFSNPLSIAEVVKSAKQAYYNGDTSMYSLPNNQEKGFILSYVPSMKSGKRTIINSFVDTNLQHTRISVQMANVNTETIQKTRDELQPVIDSIFNPAKYNVEMTGTSLVFLAGTKYMTNHLVTSLILALVTIAFLLALLLNSTKMVIISLIPNILPQILTAALMGFLGIAITPSTIIIFSIALGISVDNSIQYLSRYRFQLHITNWNIKESVISAIRETGYSMIYSSTVLFLGFAIFSLSSFGGIQAMGFLISFTLLLAMLSNLFLLPSMLLTLDKWSTTKDFDEPFLEILEEEEDINETGQIENNVDIESSEKQTLNQGK